MTGPRTGWWAALLVCGTVIGHVACRPGTPRYDEDAGRYGSMSAPAMNQAGRQGIKFSDRSSLVASLGRLPLAFEPNEGQVDPAVKFLTRGFGYRLFFTQDGATWALDPRETSHDSRRLEPRDGVDDPHRLTPSRSVHDRSMVDVVRMRILGASPDARVTGLDEHAGKAHYFHGNDPAQWHTNVPRFARIRYTGIYPGVDLVYHGREGELEYDFVVDRGIDPAIIALGFEGAEQVWIDQRGDLVVDTGDGHLVQRKPFVYQQVAGKRRVIETSYALTAVNRVGFAVGDYDRNLPLVIDPVLAYSTYLGGSGGSYGEQAYGIATDAFDNVYVTGNTTSTTFPVDGGSPATNDMFVVKLTAAGELAYVAVVNGNSIDSGEGITVDSNGSAIVTGWTDSTDFPTFNPIRLNQPGRDGFLMKLDPSGFIVYSTYLGGNNTFDYAEAVAVDAAGNTYVTGVTNSSDFPVLNGPQQVGQGQDAFVAKVDANGSLLYSTYLGGSSSDGAESIAVDAAGSFYVTGWTQSSNFPRVNSTQLKQSGNDVFVSQFTPDGSTLVYSRFLGGNSHETPYAITLDGAGGVYVGGRTDSTNFPAVLPVQPNQPGTDVFLTRLGPNGVVSFSTYLGGNGYERILGLSVRDGRVYATGQTFSTDFPSVNAVQPAKAGDPSTADAFVISLDILSAQLRYSTYLGGAATEEGRGVAALSGGNVFVAGWTESSDFPTVAPLQDFKSNIGNVFISRIAPIGIDAVSPGVVQSAGGDAITITGQGFVNGAIVLIGATPATGVSVLNSANIIATTPVLSPGTVDVTVTNPDGGSSTLYNGLTVIDGTGPIADAGIDQTLEATSPAGRQVVLDGSASWDPDNEPLTYQWRDANGNILATGAVVTHVFPLGAHLVTLTVSDGHPIPGVDTLLVQVVDTTPPAVSVVAPNGSNRIYTRTATIIDWTALDSASDLSSFDVFVSTNNGVSYAPVSGCMGVSGALRSCTWMSPGPVSTKARIRVTARDAAGNAASDTSDGVFSIIDGVASVRITAPNTGVNWGAGSTQQIKWSHNLGTAAFVRLEASFDGGSNWSVINGAVKNSSSSSGIYNWTVPGVLSSATRIRASWTNGPVADTSDVNFTIASAFVALTTPAASSNWGYGTTRTQTWTTNLGPLDRVNVALSTDSGATFPIQLTTNAVATSSATFVTPALPATTLTARVRVVWANAPPGFAAQGTSPANFRIDQPFVTVTSPDGGNTWTVGTSRSITWSQNLGNLENVRIELSQDNGATYPIVVLSSTPSDGTQSVVVGPWTTAVARVRITWLKSSSVVDVSNANFSIISASP
jgi:IPT/TIG domain/Beta-propeller repeat/PKD domain